MIFLTVGTQLPFDRLVRAVDGWCARSDNHDVFGQIAGGYRPRHFAWSPFVEPEEFDRRFADADLVVAHAGMGTVISALTFGRPLLMLPRRASLGEHRNDHQVATARQFANRPGIHVAEDEMQVPSLLTVLHGRHDQVDASQATPRPHADESIISAVRSVIIGEGGAGARS